MRQRRVTGIEERLAPYADLILRGAGEREDAGERLSPRDDIQLHETGERGNAGERLAPCKDLQLRGASERGRSEKQFTNREDLQLRGAREQGVARGLQGDGGSAPISNRWYQRTSPRYALPEGYERVYAEFGCGRGLFINTLAAADPQGLYIGIEGCKTIVIRGLQKTMAAGLKNIRYIDAFVNNAESAFGAGALHGIFLNFSDPWPKERHADRRLTAPAKAANYYHILAPGGFVSLKTDSEAFFRYSLAAFADAGFRVVCDPGGNGSTACDSGSTVCDNGIPACPGTPAIPDNADIASRAAQTPTEYELKFRDLGKPIYHFTALKNV